MKNKGQAAMEFLMTYGWAILVVIAAIAALAYFGVLDPAKLLPERCQSSAGMDCIDKASIKTSGVEFALRNNLGFPISVTGISGTDCAGPETDAVAGTAGVLTPVDPFVPETVANNQVMKLGIACTLTSGAKYDDTLVVNYTNTESGLSNQVAIDVRGKVI
jgi:hypothetical protein